MTQTTEDTGFPEKFIQSDCTDAKSHIEHPLSREYVARLERIAQSALIHLRHSDCHSNEMGKRAEIDLLVAFGAMNFMK